MLTGWQERGDCYEDISTVNLVNWILTTKSSTAILMIDLRLWLLSRYGQTLSNTDVVSNFRILLTMERLSSQTRQQPPTAIPGSLCVGLEEDRAHSLAVPTMLFITRQYYAYMTVMLAFRTPTTRSRPVTLTPGETDTDNKFVDINNGRLSNSVDGVPPPFSPRRAAFSAGSLKCFFLQEVLFRGLV